MWVVARVILSMLLVLGLVKGLSYLLSRYAPPGLGGVRAARRLQVMEATSLPGGVGLYIVRYRSYEILIASSRSGLVKLHTYSLDEAEGIDAQQPLDYLSHPEV